MSSEVGVAEAPCPLCGNRDLEPWTEARDVEYASVSDVFAYLRCAACDVLTIHPVPRTRLSEIYPHNYYSFGDSKPGFTARVKEALDRRFFHRILEQMEGESLAALDVGGGSGWLLDVVKGLDPRIATTQVVDIDSSAASVARTHGHDFFEGTIESYETDDRFDLVLMLNIIEHVADPRAVMERVRRLVAPGGLVLIKTPNHDSLDARLFRRRSWAGLHCPRHWVLFSKQSFDALCQDSGFLVREFRYTQGAPFWAASVLATLGEWGWIRVGADRPPVHHPLFGALAAIFAAFDMLRAPFGGKPSQMFYLLAPDPFKPR